jgi:hypothetical protein
MAHSHVLSDEENAVLRALQEGRPVPPVTDPAWRFLVWAGLVRIDQRIPPTVELTAMGRRHPTD